MGHATLGHVGLNVTDLAGSIAFYQRVLGLEVLREEKADDGRGFAFLGRDGVPRLTLWQQSSGAFDAARPGLHHLAFQVDTLEEVASTERTLREMDVEFHHDGLVAHGPGSPSGGVFFTGPDGVRLEVFAGSGLPGDAPTAVDGPACGFF